VGGGVQQPTVLSSDMLSVISEIEVSTLLRNGNVVAAAAAAATIFFFRKSIQLLLLHPNPLLFLF
jgi:hypothetical protein